VDAADIERLRSAVVWRKNDGEHSPASVPFEQKLALMPARAILLYEDIKSGAVQNWLQTPDGRPITIVAVDDAGSPFVVHLLNVSARGAHELLLAPEPNAPRVIVADFRPGDIRVAHDSHGYLVIGTDS
jgi:hypothetical protein